MRILYFTDWFSPAFKAGGPIRSAQYLMEMGISSIEFYVLTSNQDLDGSRLDVRTDEWIELEGHNKIMYVSSELSLNRIRSIIAEVNPDGFHINGMFSKEYSIMPMKVIGEMDRWSDVILSPRGMLEPSALEFKKWKKKLFLKSVSLLPWWKRVFWHATHEGEWENIQKSFGQNILGKVVANPCMKPEGGVVPIEKESGHLTICHVGRLHPIKGLHVLLESLRNIEADRLNVQIVGPVEDETYYAQCREIAGSLPDHIRIDWFGPVSPSEVHRVQSLSHALVLPSQSENFGHAIYENLALGRPVAIGPNTPWKELEAKGIGYVCELTEAE